MSEHRFTIEGDFDFIQLDKLLKLMRVVGSGGEAHAVIQEGMVLVNGQVEMQKRKKIRKGDQIEFNGEHIKRGVMEGTRRSNISKGALVAIVLKKDQRSGALTEGVVKDILTNSPTHPHGIKVRLEDGQVGRVKEVIEE